MNVLGIDPGFANCGWAIVNVGREVVEAGVITTTVKLEHDQRIARIYDELYRIATTYKVQQIVNERLPYNSKMQGTSSIVEVIGVIALMATRLGVPRIEYSPATAKKTICGNGRADKIDVIAHINYRDKLVEHSADAALLALTYLELDYGRNV